VDEVSWDLEKMERYADAEWLALAGTVAPAPSEPDGMERIRRAATPGEVEYLVRAVFGTGWLSQQAETREAMRFNAGLAADARDGGLPFGLVWANVRKHCQVDAASPVMAHVWEAVRFGMEAIYYGTWRV